MTGTDVAARIAELRGADAVDAAELDALWDALAPVCAEEILGRWKGDSFATGHPWRVLLVACRWYGKHLNAVDDVKPLICRAEDGSLYSNVDLTGGEASLWNVEFRGEVTATVVYDTMPVLDHFKRVDEDILLGVMNGKAPVLHNGHHFYFLLERQA
ncbi:GXWXG protein [Lentzea atacamensis]|uniref:GXWXG protein n=1 Tax=Lentzea atacamensis TaxID=531938 RepID=A0ABX9DY85_9PSEU|nr:DUF4334 domain-containing protein [Lentzea atacamensis]RAS60654.1 GXWXG protein [Lentzea atacamensis]